MWADAICCRERMDSLNARDSTRFDGWAGVPASANLAASRRYSNTSSFTGSKPLASRRRVAGSTNWVDYSPGSGSVRPKGSKRVLDNKPVEVHTSLRPDSAVRTTNNSRAALGAQPGMPIFVSTFLSAFLHLCDWGRLSLQALLFAGGA
jgi:hypothetical protein